ncbi:MAG TPA: class I adenylate-forming enzyme family protein [Thermoanaerobaculia bacterium]|nr:class I adenylate-forming enzyme family protein [Thermoanaerobaculia bacterium]
MSSLLASFREQCGVEPEALAVWSRGEGLELSFRELALRVEARAERLDTAPGELVAVATGNRVAFLELFLALRARGSVMAAMDGSLAEAAKVALCRRLSIGRLIVAQDGPGEDTREIAVAGVNPPDVRPYALVKLTSGSTGDPVGICLTEEALLAGIDHIGRGMGLDRRDRVLIAIPLSHSYGFDNGVLSLAGLGTALILEPGFYPQALLRALVESRATFFPAVPPMVRALAETDWPEGLSLRQVISAGGPLAPEFARGLLERSGQAVHQFYGSTETGGISFESDPEAAEAAGTVGWPLPGVEVLLGEGGRIEVDSAANFSAWLGQPPRTERKVCLGDRGEWTAEGRLRLVGRVADLLNVGGRRVSATAVEGALRTLPGVSEAAVVGLADAVRGDRLVAFLVGEGGPLPTSRLPAGLAPRDIRWISALPYSERGKLDRAQLRSWALERVGP